MKWHYWLGWVFGIICLLAAWFASYHCTYTN